MSYYASGIGVKGTAPGAKLVVQSIGDQSYRLGGLSKISLTNLFKVPYEGDNVRIHTNSWGVAMRDKNDGKLTGDLLSYSGLCELVDDIVSEKRDLVILYAAGNDGGDDKKEGVAGLGTISHYAYSKNCITVGASENLRKEIKAKWGDWRNFESEPITSDLIANNENGMAAWSSRGGPLPHTRIKPDVVAPGTAIFSARSSRITNPKFNPEFYAANIDPEWWYTSGTSMATPLVAGCCAVIRQSLVTKDPQFAPGKKGPSAALIKALLINGAVMLSGQYKPPYNDTGPSPNPNSGWGRVNVDNSIILSPTGATSGYVEGAPLKIEAEDKKGNRAFDINIAQAGKTLKVTLVWTDRKGESLQNDLDLIVKHSNGQEWHGNQGAPGGGYDRTNNVEQVQWLKIPTGKATVTVQAFRFWNVGVEQDYGLAWTLL